jgi:hypothetical protein
VPNYQSGGAYGLGNLSMDHAALIVQADRTCDDAGWISDSVSHAGTTAVCRTLRECHPRQYRRDSIDKRMLASGLAQHPLDLADFDPIDVGNLFDCHAVL